LEEASLGILCDLMEKTASNYICFASMVFAILSQHQLELLLILLFYILSRIGSYLFCKKKYTIKNLLKGKLTEEI